MHRQTDKYYYQFTIVKCENYFGHKSSAEPSHGHTDLVEVNPRSIIIQRKKVKLYILTKTLIL